MRRLGDYHRTGPRFRGGAALSAMPKGLPRLVRVCTPKLKDLVDHDGGSAAARGLPCLQEEEAGAPPRFVKNDVAPVWYVSTGFRARFRKQAQRTLGLTACGRALAGARSLKSLLSLTRRAAPPAAPPSSHAPTAFF